MPLPPFGADLKRLINLSVADVQRLHDWYLLLANLGAERSADQDLAARLEVWLDRHS